MEFGRGCQATAMVIAVVHGVAGCRVSDSNDPAASVSGSRPGPPVAAGPQSETPGQAVQVTSVAAPATAVAANPLNPDRAIAYVRQICKLGPRVTGSQAMLAQQKVLTAHFEGLGGKVRLQSFQIRHPERNAAVTVSNFIVHWNPTAKDRILLCAHYDTRPQADNSGVPAHERGGLFLGANDGASGVALFMELAHFVPALKSRYGVDFLLTDAEEFVFSSTPVKQQRYFVGSEYFARDYAAKPPNYRYEKGAVLDMIGDRRLEIYQDRNSVWWKDTRPVTSEIWATAKRLGVNEFIPRTHPRMRQPIRDDHLNLRNLGRIPTCEIIDFDYPKYPVNRFWHTAADTPDKCSGRSLARVGWVMLEWLRNAQ